MTFTPFHMGPGLLIKALLQGSFSLVIFGWAQVVMDIQPLLVMISGEGHLHGFSHTYLGALLLAAFSALTGKYLAEWGLRLIKLREENEPPLSWWVVFLSALIGTFSHVLLDSVMHSDVQPFFPFSTDNWLWRMVSVSALHQFCIYSGLIGAAVYLSVRGYLKFSRN